MNRRVKRVADELKILADMIRFTSWGNNERENAIISVVEKYANKLEEIAKADD